MDRDEIISELWSDAIIAGGPWLENVAKMNPKEPYGEAATALNNLLAAGASKEDLAKVIEFATYEAVFTTLSTLDNHEALAEGAESLYEDLLSARPG